MSTVGPPSLPERREALLAAARRLLAEAGPDGGALLDPGLASDLAAGMSEDIAAAIGERTARVTSTDELVDALVDAALGAAEPWSDGLLLANVALEQVRDFERFNGLIAPWLDAIEHAILRGQEQGFVRGDIEPHETALVLRDALDRTAKVALRFRHDGYRQATTALVRGALAPEDAASTK